MNRRDESHQVVALHLTIGLLLMLASPVLAAGPTRCLTYEEPTLHRLQTICADGTRAISAWNSTLGQWQTTITAPPGRTCMSTMDPRTKQVEVRCR